MKLISIVALTFLSSCSFLSDHPELVDEVKKVEKEVIDDAATDAKKLVDKEQIPLRKVKK